MHRVTSDTFRVFVHPCHIRRLKDIRTAMCRHTSINSGRSYAGSSPVGTFLDGTVAQFGRAGHFIRQHDFRPFRLDRNDILLGFIPFFLVSCWFWGGWSRW